MAYFDAASNSLDPKLAGWDALLRNNFKLIVNRQVNKRTRRMLFHLEGDPGEMVDRRIDFPDRVGAMNREIGRIRGLIRKRLKQNALRLKGSLDLGAEARKAYDTLKSLGYL